MFLYARMSVFDTYDENVASRPPPDAAIKSTRDVNFERVWLSVCALSARLECSGN